MFKRVPLLALVSMLILAVAGCSSGQQPTPQTAQTEAPPPKPVEKVPIYDLIKDDITTQPNWTSRNISILGVKLGDITRNVEKNLGELANTRTAPDDYITAYRDGGIVIHTFKLTGKARKIEITQLMKGIKDQRLARLLSTGNLATMREIFGMEEAVEENKDDMSTEYSYDDRGFRFVKYRIEGKTVNAIRFSEMRRSTT
jgi:hypothetical protein